MKAMNDDMPKVNLCACTGFSLWYRTDDEQIYVCVCGHPNSEHIARLLDCTGDVVILPARQET